MGRGERRHATTVLVFTVGFASSVIVLQFDEILCNGFGGNDVDKLLTAKDFCCGLNGLRTAFWIGACLVVALLCAVRNVVSDAQTAFTRSLVRGGYAIRDHGSGAEARCVDSPDVEAPKVAEQLERRWAEGLVKSPVLTRVPGLTRISEVNVRRDKENAAPGEPRSRVPFRTIQPPETTCSIGASRAEDLNRTDSKSCQLEGEDSQPKRQRAATSGTKRTSTQVTVRGCLSGPDGEAEEPFSVGARGQGDHTTGRRHNLWRCAGRAAQHAKRRRTATSTSFHNLEHREFLAPYGTILCSLRKKPDAFWPALMLPAEEIVSAMCSVEERCLAGGCASPRGALVREVVAGNELLSGIIDLERSCEMLRMGEAAAWLVPPAGPDEPRIAVELPWKRVL